MRYVRVVWVEVQVVRLSVAVVRFGFLVVGVSAVVDVLQVSSEYKMCSSIFEPPPPTA